MCQILETLTIIKTDFLKKKKKKKKKNQKKKKKNKLNMSFMILSYRNKVWHWRFNTDRELMEMADL